MNGTFTNNWRTRQLAFAMITLLVGVSIYVLAPGMSHAAAPAAINMGPSLQSGGGCSAPGFATATDFSEQLEPDSIILADVNGDGNLDALTTSFDDQSRGPAWRPGNGSGGFGAQSTVTVNGPVLSAVVDDFNKDGKPDVAAAYELAPILVIAYGDGAGGFSNLVRINVSGGGKAPLMNQILAADFNKDGNLDLANLNIDPDAIALLLGDGRGNFANPTLFPLPARALGMALGDFNKDGNSDLVAVNNRADSVSVLLNNGSGGFGAASTVPAGAGPFEIGVSDFNKDGNPDIATTNFAANTVSVLLGNGSGGFASPTAVAVAGGPLAIGAADFTGDGNVDLAVATLNGDPMAVLPGDGAGKFGSAVTVTLSSSPSGLAIGDLNKDGKPDVVTYSFTAKRISSLVNNCVAVQTTATSVPPTATVPAPSATPAPPTATAAPPTSVPAQPTSIPVPPTSVPATPAIVPTTRPANTPVKQPTVAPPRPTATHASGGGASGSQPTIQPVGMPRTGEADGQALSLSLFAATLGLVLLAAGLLLSRRRAVR